MTFAPERLLDRLTALSSVEHYLIAFSGGLDSTVLLHALAQTGARARFSIATVHVNHGLQPQAEQWAEHCRRVCGQWTVHFSSVRVDARAACGESPEAAAREARYAALRGLVKSGACLLTAHQQDDQAETLLLQLLRGAGPAGLAAMPEITRFGAGWHARPLLGFMRAELAAYAAQYELKWIEDPSNLSSKPDRNFIRNEVASRLRMRWPAAARTLSRACALQADAVALFDELAQQDSPAVIGARPDTLSITRLKELSPARQRNLLRHWLVERGLPTPTKRQLEHVLTDCVDAKCDSAPVVAWPGAETRRYRDDLYAMKPLPAHDPTVVLRWNAHTRVFIPHLGVSLEPSMLGPLGISIAADRLDVTIRFRRGGERCKPRGQQHHHDLKKLFQEAGVPPWERDRIPLIYVGECLAAVIGHWSCDPE